MIKYISGTWFEFQHANTYEGKYWNGSCSKFSKVQWESKVKEIYETGMDYLVLMCTALNDEAYFETDIYKPASIKCENALEVILSICDKYKMKVFVGAGFYGNWAKAKVNMTDNIILKRAMKAMEELAFKFSKHKSFYGWYLPDESYIDKHFNSDFMNYVNLLGGYGRQLIKDSKILIAPYGTRDAMPDDDYVRQLENLDCDVIAYQDEIGVRKTKLQESAGFYEGLYYAHKKAGRAQLWADVEIFNFEGNVYKSALIPAPFERIKKQLEAVSPYVEKILVYQFEGMMNKENSEAFAGHADSVKLYTDYADWMTSNYPDIIRI